MATKTTGQRPIKQLKRPDLVAQEIKRLITEKNLSPGDRLPRESELQTHFEVSKGTIREALKSLEVQGLVTISTGPSGGGTIAEVPLDRTLQFMQNYLFFQEVTIDNIYTVRQLLELFREATAADRGEAPWPVLVWERKGRFHDGMRPGVEPEGLRTPEEVIANPNSITGRYLARLLEETGMTGRTT